jgi:hypothetical protein
MADETKAIEFWPCGYQARCNARNFTTKANSSPVVSTLADDPCGNMSYAIRTLNKSAARERGKGRQIIWQQVNR